MAGIVRPNSKPLTAQRLMSPGSIAARRSRTNIGTETAGIRGARSTQPRYAEATRNRVSARFANATPKRRGTAGYAKGFTRCGWSGWMAWFKRLGGGWVVIAVPERQMTIRAVKRGRNSV